MGLKKLTRKTGSNPMNAGRNVAKVKAKKAVLAHDVVDALENPRYKWRTVAGVARDAGVQPEAVYRVIEKLGSGVVRASVASATGDELFTTRRHLKSKESFLSRIGAVLRNRAA